MTRSLKVEKGQVETAITMLRSFLRDGRPVCAVVTPDGAFSLREATGDEVAKIGVSE